MCRGRGLAGTSELHIEGRTEGTLPLLFLGIGYFQLFAPTFLCVGFVDIYFFNLTGVTLQFVAGPPRDLVFNGGWQRRYLPP